MLMPRLIFFISILGLFWSCKTDIKGSCAIKDFKQSLQPYLVKIVSKGIVMRKDSSLQHMATDNELIQLSHSEHPVLRASAFREMLHRTSFNHFDIIMNHLTDTAFVETDAGEFGISRRTVSDDILKEAKWNSEDEKRKTIEQVLINHNYLRSAYTILLDLEPQQKYYSFIKQMATRPRQLSNDGHELAFGDIEYALYGLAKFKKSEDVKLIKNKMTANIRKLSEVSFRLMKEYPDTVYFDILEAYHYRQFYKFSGNRPGEFSGYFADRVAPEDFIQALVIQESDKSAELLDTMLNRLYLQTCMPDKDYILDNIVTAIWEHPCPAYETLRQKIKPKALKILKSKVKLPIDSSYQVQLDTVARKIRW